MGHREVQYRGLWDIERCNIGDYGTQSDYRIKW